MGTSQNSLILYLCAYVEHIFKDVQYTYTGSRDWKRDKTRLLHEVRQHGSQVLTITLPSVGKSLDKALDVGLYQPSGSYLGKTRKGEQVPVFLRDLFAQVFNPSDGMLREQPCVGAIMALRQILMGCKKILLPCTSRRVYGEVIDFAHTEAVNRCPSLDWISDDLISASPGLQPGAGRISFSDVCRAPGQDPESTGFWPEEDEGVIRSSFLQLRLLQRVCDEVFAAMGDFSYEEALRPKHGPGAVSDLRRGMSKYQFLDWPSKLERVFPYDGYAVHDFLCSSSLSGPGEWRNREVPSKLIAVPKTQKGPRLIAAEPSQHQWVQQLLKQQLERAVERGVLGNCITFRDQSHNQAAALWGSKEGGNVTIDLSSASDRLTCWTVERATRANWSLIDRLHACRTRWVRNGVDERGFGFLKLRKFATQGSAVIFPLQSIIYACIAISGTILSEERERILSSSIESASHRVRVFGDDIIVPVEAYQYVTNFLHDLGLKVNADKTFTGSNFRESCGVDGFRGHDVSPTYLRLASSSARETEVYSFLEVANNLWLKGYWHTAAWLDRMVSRWDHLIPVVGHKSTRLGRKSFSGPKLNHLSKRWNAKTQKEEVRVVSIVEKTKRLRGTDRQDLMQWFTEEPEPGLPWGAGSDLAKVVTLRPGWQAVELFALS